MIKKHSEVVSQTLCFESDDDRQGCVVVLPKIKKENSLKMQIWKNQLCLNIPAVVLLIRNPLEQTSLFGEKKCLMQYLIFRDSCINKN